MKSRPSKLDQFATQIADMDIEKKTLHEIAVWLLDEGCKVSTSALSEYLERLRSQRRQAALLSQITSGARQAEEVEKQFGKNPAPELETLIKLQRVILLNLSTQANADPSLLDLIGNSFRAVLTAEKLKLQREEVSLARDKFTFDATRAALAKLPQLKAISTNKELSDDQKLEQARLALFGSAPQ